MRPAPTRVQSLGLRVRPRLPGNKTPAPWEDRVLGQRVCAVPPVSPETGLFLVAVRPGFAQRVLSQLSAGCGRRFFARTPPWDPLRAVQPSHQAVSAFC
ncbi:hypothetical protein M2375_001192 [Comamonas sp. BIGb0152]|nr:hypothetical protein [Comamonas sp. BIGb0152]